VAFSPDGKLLASLDGPLVRFWEVASGKTLSSRLPTGHEGDVNSVAFTPDGQTLISTGGDLTIRWWDTRTGQQRLSLLCMKNHFRLYEGFPKAALSPDGTTLATTCVDVSDEGTPAKDKKGLRGSIRLWDAATGKELRRLDSGNGAATALVFSPDGKLLAEGFWPKGNPSSVVRLWDVASGKRSEHELAGTCPVFSSDSSILATIGSLGPRRAIRFWKAATGEKIHTMSTNEDIRCLAFSPDGKTLATGSDTITLYLLSWDKQSGVQVGPPRLAAFSCGAITTLAFSPDGRMLASSGSDLAIHLWETASGKERARLQGLAATALNTYVESLTFSADGRRLASGSADSTILLWDVTGRFRDGELRPAKLSEKELEDRWAGLASNDAMRAGRAIWSLVAAGPQAISLLGERLRPAIAKVSPELVDRLITDLDAENFKTRQKARRELAKLGELCEPALRRALAKRPSLELRRSLQELLSQLDEERKGSPSGDVLRGARAVEVLEQIGTPEARQVLKTLAKGAPLARLTHEAQAALQRIDWRMARRPTRAD
jgi:WD40 repeat protein